MTERQLDSAPYEGPRIRLRYRSSLEALRLHRKSDYGAPAYSRFINRRFGRRLAAAAYAFGMTPNQVTLVSAGITLSGIMLLVAVPPSAAVGVGVAVLLAIGYAFDSADGQLARLRGGGRPAGQWLDHTIDIARTVMVHGAVLLAWLRFDSISWTEALVPLAFATVAVVGYSGRLLVHMLRSSSPGVAAGDEPTGAMLSRSLLRLPSDYGLLVWIFVLWGSTLFLPVYSFVLLANTALLAIALPVWYRQVAALPRSRSESTTRQGVVGYIPGVYDLFHVGHLNILRNARAHCDYLIAGAVTDERAEAVKGRRPVIPLDQRLEILSSIGLVDEVVADDSTAKSQMLQKVRFDVLFKGDDWKGTPKGDQLERDMAEHGVRVHYLPYTTTTSSSMLRSQMDEHHSSTVARPTRRA